jgi:hypothetical protein
MTTQKNFEQNAVIVVLCMVLSFLIVAVALCLNLWGAHDLVAVIKAVIVAGCVLLAVIGAGVAVIVWMVKK